MRGNRIQVMDYMLDALSMEETLNLIDQMIQNGTKCQHVVLNAGKVVLANKDEKLRKLINECELINADGQSIVWAARFLGKYIPERVTGIDLMYEILRMAEKKGYGIYFFGAKEEILNKAIQNLKKQFPDLIVSGRRNGYFSDVDINEITKDMQNSGAKILLVGFSSPRKEYWLKENMDKIGIPFCMGVGGSFDIAAGLTKRAPALFQHIGMEWLFRLLQEPQRMWKRYLVGNTSFIWYVFKCGLNEKKKQLIN